MFEAMRQVIFGLVVFMLVKEASMKEWVGG